MKFAKQRSSAVRVAVAAGTTLLLAVAASCGGGSDDSLSEEAARGKRIASSRGCAACHGASGQGGVGPTWEGLAGSEVALVDGTTVIADDAYLVRAIVEPGAELVEGYPLQMPKNELSEAEVADVVAYINELSDAGG